MLNDYLTLEGLALQLALPKAYLKRLVDTGKLPYIDTGNKRKRFQEKAVREALARIEKDAVKASQTIIGGRDG